MSPGARKWQVCGCRGELYGVDLKWLSQIDYQPRLLRLPTAEPPLLGLISWGGRELPAVSLGQVLGLEAEGEAIALMLKAGGMDFGLMIAELGETMEVPPEAFLELKGYRSQVVAQVARCGQALVYGLNIEAFVPRIGSQSLSEIETHRSIEDAIYLRRARSEP